MTQVNALEHAILRQNIEAYYARYQMDVERLLPSLTLRLESPPVYPDLEVPEPMVEYHPRIAVICGLTTIPFLEAFEKVWPVDAIFVIESDPIILSHQFQSDDWTKLLKNDKFHFFLGYDKNTIIAPMQRVMRHTTMASKIYLSQIITPAPTDLGVRPEYREVYNTMPEIIRVTVDHVFFNFGQMDDSIEGLRASMLNKDFIMDNPGVEELKDSCKGLPSVVCCAGPSLDEQISLLKEHQDKFIIIATDAVVKPLIAAGIRIDFVTSIERYNALQIPFFTGLEPQTAELVAYPVVHPEVLKLWPGPKRVTYRNYAWYAYFEKMAPRGILESGGSTSHLATKLSFHLGCDITLILGGDHAYRQKADTETFVTHCKGTGYPEWEEYKALSTIKEKYPADKSFYVEANDGSQVLTTIILYQFIKEFSSLSLNLSAGKRLINCSLKGAKMSRIEYHPFEDFCAVAVPINIPKFTRTLSRNTRSWSHKDLLQNLTGYQRIVRTGNNALLFMEEMMKEYQDGDLLKQVYDLFFNKIATETLFTAFIIQNCASEFFRVETQWYAIPNGPFTEKYAERLEALLALYSLLDTALTKHIKAIEEGHVV